MNTLGSTVMTAAICAVGLSLAACTAAGTTAGTTAGTAAGPAKPASPAGGRTASSSATAAAQTAPGCTVSGGLVQVEAVGSFPVPPGAQVVENVSAGKLVGMVLSSVAPSQISGFYKSALPRAGYKITSDTGKIPGASPELLFTGHGYLGMVAAAAGMAKVPRLPAGASAKICPGVRLSSIGKDVAWISFAPN